MLTRCKNVKCNNDYRVLEGDDEDDDDDDDFAAECCQKVPAGF